MDYALTEDDMKVLLPGVRVITYPELKAFSCIEEAMGGPNGKLVILFLTTGLSEGHWVGLQRIPDTKKGTPVIEFFDSYGIRPEGEKKWLSHSQLVYLDEDEPILRNLLVDAAKRGYQIDYSQHQFQDEEDTSETCGRHVAMRLLHGGMNLKKYKDFITSTHLTPDEFVLLATKPVLGK